MNFLEKLCTQDIKKTSYALAKMKEMRQRRAALAKAGKLTSEGLAVAKMNKLKQGWSDKKDMKLVYEIPADVYFSDPEYWDSIIRSGNFSRHPEWIVK